MNKDYNFIVKLTTSCPGNCKCCHNRQENFKYKNENSIIFDLDTFDKICKGIKKLKGTYICISGGEPTIVKNLTQYISIAHKYDLATRINTNGWNVTIENLTEWLNNGLDQIVLSVYGLDKSTILKTRGNVMIYDKSMEAINIIKKLKEKYNFIFILQTVIMKDNYLQLPELLKLAIDNNADIFWPSYLEDAINLPSVRLSRENITDFVSNVIPKMREIICETNLEEEIKKEILVSLDSFYNDGTNLYQYHGENFRCKWQGKHFTFYPNRIVDPCPGHEYFMSDFQHMIDYKKIDEFMTLENLMKYSDVFFDYCKYCPQGVHHSISFLPSNFNEHDRKENE